MIQSKKQLKEWIAADFRAQHGGMKDYSIKQYWMTRILAIVGVEHFQISRFEYLLRKAEYHKNTNHLIRFAYHKFYKERWARKLGYNIPENVVRGGVRLGHAGSIVINKSAKIGQNVTLHIGVNIANGCIIGSNVYVGPGAKFISACYVDDDSKVGANAVVNKSFKGEKGATLVGVPAKSI